MDGGRCRAEENHLEEVDWLRRLGSLTAVGMKADALQAWVAQRAAEALTDRLRSENVSPAPSQAPETSPTAQSVAPLAPETNDTAPAPPPN